MITKDNLVTKYIYNTSGVKDDRLYIKDKNDDNKEFICEDKNENKVNLSYDTVFKDYTSITPIYVASIKKYKDKIALVLNKYLSEWDDPEKGFMYAYAMEIDIKEAIKNEKTYKPNWIVYNRTEIDKTPKYQQAKTKKVIYGYYTTPVNSILFFLEKAIDDLYLVADMYKIKHWIEYYINYTFGVQYIHQSQYDKVVDYVNGKDIDLEIYNIYNIPLNFRLIDRSSVKLLPYDFTLNLQEINKYYTPYNIVILNVLRTDSVYIMAFHNKSILSNDVEYKSSLTKDEISILLDFDKD